MFLTLRATNNLRVMAANRQMSTRIVRRLRRLVGRGHWIKVPALNRNKAQPQLKVPLTRRKRKNNPIMPIVSVSVSFAVKLTTSLCIGKSNTNETQL